VNYRTWLWLVALPLIVSTAHADKFWYTDPAALGPFDRVSCYDSATNTIAPLGGITAGPKVAVTYTAPGSPTGIDSLRSAVSVGPLVAYVDGFYVCLIDTDTASPTYNTVIQTIDFRDPAVPADSPGLQFVRFHPTGSRVYVSGVGSPTSVPSIRIARVLTPLPDVEYKFDPNPPAGFLIDKLTNETGGEWVTLPGEFGTSPSAHRPLGMDVDPTGGKLYWCCHQEMEAQSTAASTLIRSIPAATGPATSM